MDLPAAIMEEAEHAPGKMRCAQWVEPLGAGYGRGEAAVVHVSIFAAGLQPYLLPRSNAAAEVIEEELPTLLSRCTLGGGAGAAEAGLQGALLVLMDSQRGMPQHHFPIEKEAQTVHQLAPQVSAPLLLLITGMLCRQAKLASSNGCHTNKFPLGSPLMCTGAGGGALLPGHHWSQHSLQLLWVPLP